MNLLVRYQPLGEGWYEFELEQGVTITKFRGKPTLCSVTLPTIPSIVNASGYGNLHVLGDNQYLFDGKSQNKITY